MASNSPAMVDALGLGLGVGLLLVTVTVLYTRGVERGTGGDVTDAVLEARARTLPETDFPEPGNRSVGGSGGGGVAAGEAAEGEEGGEGEADAGPASIPDDEAEVFEVEYVKEGATLDVRENQTILEAGEEEGWDLPYACREGQCLSCGGHVTNGPSEDYLIHDGQEMLDESELGDGYTLTCVAYPTADLSIETDETP
jgi:2Fe-2S type ferredoxin